MSLCAYMGIAYRALVDIVVFGLIPMQGQMIAIVILVVIQIAHLVYKHKVKVNEDKMEH